ncbi:MAG: outer membrane lipoprotein carrier protein LolA [Phycisphaeraceae bacterium]|nr:outer membrane lipoprotein carrier protein LolA [Phycisphaeraceae bacterium]
MLKLCVMLMGLFACAQSPPESQTAAVDPVVEQWLTKIEARAQEVKTLRARLNYTREQGLLGDMQRRFGQLIYQAGPPARFCARFDQIVVDDAVHGMDKTYTFDGRYMVERDGGEKIFSRWDLAKEGETADLLTLGEGPFALPLNMNKSQVLSRFEVALADDGEDQPLHLVLTPRQDVEMDASKVELWFDRDTLLPVRARTENEDREDASDVKLREVELNPDDIADEAFNTDLPDDASWQVNEYRTQETQEAQQ